MKNPINSLVSFVESRSFLAMAWRGEMRMMSPAIWNQVSRGKVHAGPTCG